MEKYPRCLVFWVPAISRESFELAYRDIGILLRIPGITDDNADVKGLVKEELDKNGSCEWLMIVDNADDPQVLTGPLTGNATSSRLMDYLPRRDRGAILFTTRSRKAAYSLTESDVLELEDLDIPQSRQLMAQRITNKALLSDEKAVEKLQALLTNLPLAIVQAVANFLPYLPNIPHRRHLIQIIARPYSVCTHGNRCLNDGPPCLTYTSAVRPASESTPHRPPTHWKP